MAFSSLACPRPPGIQAPAGLNHNRIAAERKSMVCFPACLASPPSLDEDAASTFLAKLMTARPPPAAVFYVRNGIALMCQGDGNVPA